MKQFRLVDNILGWVSFLIAAFVYCSTIEPTASFWDCPEFISTGYKLEVGHPPGAPFFMLTANLFTQFVSDPSQVARMVNMMSALLSATCIMFLFWTISHLARKLILNDWSELSLSKTIAIEASAMVGALIYTFSDTFWFSAVEGEVYAYSSAFTAIVFWLILKWEDHADEPQSDRWLVLIMFMTGLSVGVHLLNLLCVPAIVLVFYYRKFPEANLKGSLIALALSFVIVAGILYGLIPGMITVGGWFELRCVNDFGLPFNTGMIVYLLLLVLSVVWAIWETYRSNRIRQNVSFLAAIGMLGIPFYGNGWAAFFTGVVVLAGLYAVLEFLKVKGKHVVTARIKNTTLLCLLMLMIGCSTYAVIMVRSAANPPMDQNSPEDIFTLGNYLSREQYGDRPLLYGQAYTSEVEFEADGEYMKPKTVQKAPIYAQKEKASADEKDEYFILRYKTDYIYGQNMFFPRMYDNAHANAYQNWMAGTPFEEGGYDVPYVMPNGESKTVHMPSQLQNIYFFLSYQCNYMYWRYFMWNFAGRQNDIQGTGEGSPYGNWITGIDFIDSARLGDQSLLPDDLKNNKGHNVFYCLPLILGLIGLFWQAYKGKKGIQQFWVVCFLFFMTGLAIVVYLNQTPSQPRERDYAYAGSFYAYAIWCGLGVVAIIDLLKQYLKNVNPVAIASVVGALTLLVPVQMASQTWDDHDRSGRYTCRDFGQNYLMTLQDEGNPIIFTNGDNDTFPLWYTQDVEGKRTDTRVCNLSYLQTDWYIDQMIRPAYDSPSLPISWPRIDYCSGTNEYVEVNPEFKEQVLAFYKENPEAARKQYGDDPFEVKNVMKYWVRGGKGDYHCIPTDTLYIHVDKDAVRKSGMMMAADSIPDKMVISLAGKRALYKGDLMMLEMLSGANWTRPIYVACTVGRENYMNLGNNFVKEGLANRITPFTTQDEDGQPLPGTHSLDTEKMYRNLMTRYRYGGLETPGLYLDETVLRMCNTHRRLFAEIALELISEGKEDMARKALAYCQKVLPSYNVPMNYMSGGVDMARAYSALGDSKNAKTCLDACFKSAHQYAWFYANKLYVGAYQQEMYMNAYIMQMCISVADEFDKKLGDSMAAMLKQDVQLYMSKGGVLPGFGDSAAEEEEAYDSTSD